MAFPEEWIETVLTPTTNLHLTNKIRWGSFISGLDATFLWRGFKGFWIEKAGGRQGRCQCLRVHRFAWEVISLFPYKEITMAVRFTDKAPPTLERDGCVDRFHEVRDRLDVFKEFYAYNYHPSWLNVLDKLMSSWLSKFCPGFMCVPQKPHLFGNEYHSIADEDDGKPIMWRMKLV